MLTDLTQEQIDRMLEVNLRAPIALARALVPRDGLARAWPLVFISSLNGKAATPATSIYSATKFGLRGFALGLREDLRAARSRRLESCCPASSATPGCSPTPTSSCRAGSEPARRRTLRRRSIQAIERNRAELEVAPLGLRLGATFAGVAPELAAAAARRLGSTKVAFDMADAQRGTH